MAKLTQGQIKAKADEWASLGLRIQRLQDQKKAERDAFDLLHADELNAIDAKYDPRIEPLMVKQLAVEKEVLAALDEIKKPIVLSGEKADAVNESKLGSRVIDPKKFFDFVKEKNAAFWDCVSVGIAKAETLIGKKSVDGMSEKPKKLVSSLRLK